MLEVINLTNPEGAKNLTELFFEDELKMDFTADPRFNNWPEYFIASLLESAVSIGYGIDDEATCIDKKSGDFPIECKHREQRTCEAE